MNLGKEAARLGYSMEAELKMRVTETQDAFIIEKVLPYCEQETGAEIKKSDLKEMLMKNTPKPVRRIKDLTTFAECPSCFLMLGKDIHPVACGYCGQRITWEEATE